MVARKDLACASEIFACFLPKACRRPVLKDEVKRLVDVVEAAMAKDKLTFPEAVRAGLKVALCSPSFLYLTRPGP